MVSIIIPVYNVEKYIAECIESVINQSFVDWELILIDDGSTDMSSSICKKYVLLDKRIRYIYQNNSGANFARNHGIEESNGDYLMFMDADDYILSYALEVCYNKMIDNRVDIVCAECKSIMADGKPYKKNRPRFAEKIVDNREYAKMILSHRTLCSIWAKLYKKSLIIDNRFLVDSERGEDVLFFSMLLPRKRCRILLCDTVIYHYRILSQSLSHGADNIQITKLHRFNNDLKYTKSLLSNHYSDLSVYFDVAMLYNIDEIIKKQGVIKKIEDIDLVLIKQLYPNVCKTTDVRFNKSWDIVIKQENLVTISLVLSLGYLYNTLRQQIKNLILICTDKIR